MFVRNQLHQQDSNVIARYRLFMLHMLHISTGIILPTNDGINWVIGMEGMRATRQTENTGLAEILRVKFFTPSSSERVRSR